MALISSYFRATVWGQSNTTCSRCQLPRFYHDLRMYAWNSRPACGNCPFPGQIHANVAKIVRMINTLIYLSLVQNILNFTRTNIINNTVTISVHVLGTARLVSWRHHLLMSAHRPVQVCRPMQEHACWHDAHCKRHARRQDTDVCAAGKMLPDKVTGANLPNSRQTIDGL